MKMFSRSDIVFSNEPRLELNGSTQCVVDGLKGICEYNHDRIKIDLGKYCVTFFGDGLYINSFSYDGAIVEGNIISMEFGSL